jgi:diguanylate cyclase (GGDEF)-like protein
VAESPDRRWLPTRWGLWELRTRAILLVLVVEAVALAVVVTSAVHDRLEVGSMQLAGLLALLGIAHTEVATGIERLRRRVSGGSGGSYFDLTSVWTFAAAVLLPPALAAVVIAAVFGHLAVRVYRPLRIPVYRTVYTTGNVVLAAAVAQLVLQRAGGLPGGLDDLGGLGAIALAMAVYLAINCGFVAVVIAVSTGRTRPVDLFGDWDDNVLETATLSLGALAAVALTANRWLVLLVLPPLLVLHRAVLVRQLEAAASTDGKTGLLNAAAWHDRASRELRRAQRARTAAGVLILDLDHFKAVNDAHGHLAGDEVLAAVAKAVRDEVRGHDLVGRFGGEEFVVLLPDLPAADAGRSELRAVAERIRRRVSRLDVATDTPDGPLTIRGLSTSIGGAAFPADASGLEPLMQAADAALYRAKRDGRNVVRLATPPPAHERA